MFTEQQHIFASKFISHYCQLGVSLRVEEAIRVMGRCSMSDNGSYYSWAHQLLHHAVFSNQKPVKLKVRELKVLKRREEKEGEEKEEEERLRNHKKKSKEDGGGQKDEVVGQEKRMEADMEEERNDEDDGPCFDSTCHVLQIEKVERVRTRYSCHIDHMIVQHLVGHSNHLLVSQLVCVLHVACQTVLATVD